MRAEVTKRLWSGLRPVDTMARWTGMRLMGIDMPVRSNALMPSVTGTAPAPTESLLRRIDPGAWSQVHGCGAGQPGYDGSDVLAVNVSV